MIQARLGPFTEPTNPDAKGLKPPRILAEMNDIAKQFHNPPTMYGSCTVGLVPLTA